MAKPNLLMHILVVRVNFTFQLAKQAMIGFGPEDFFDAAILAT